MLVLIFPTIILACGGCAFGLTGFGGWAIYFHSDRIGLHATHLKFDLQARKNTCIKNLRNRPLRGNEVASIDSIEYPEAVTAERIPDSKIRDMGGFEEFQSNMFHHTIAFSLSKFGGKEHTMVFKIAMGPNMREFKLLKALILLI
jgi:hypothetical protein